MATTLEFAEASTLSMLAVALVAGAIGSAHCAAMCGPLVVGCARGAGFVRGAVVVQQFGRWLAYVALGSFAGAVGQSIDGFTAARGGYRLVPVVLGVVLVVMGVLSFFGKNRKPTLTFLLDASRRWIRVSPNSFRPLMLGAFSAFLPCGLLHSIVLAAAGTSSPIAGAGMMTAFFVGTAPPLLLIGIGARRIADRLGGRGGRWIEGLACGFAGFVLLFNAFSATDPGACCGSGG